MSPAPRRAPPGFTLLELLVALVVLGFILAGIGQGVLFGLRAYDTQTRDVAAHSDVDAADRLLRTLVADMDPGTAIVAPAVQGTATRLSFTTDLGRAAAALGTQDADVALMAENGSLVMRWTPSVHGTRLTAPPPFATAVLLPGVARVEFAYWGHGEGGGGAWLTAWQERDLPPLVRIRLIFPPDSHRRWPDIVVPTIRMKTSG